MALRKRKITDTRFPPETHEHAPDSRTVPAVLAESTVPYSPLRTRVGVGLLVVGTGVLFGISLPVTPLPSSLAALAALSLALGTLLVGTATTGRKKVEPAAQPSPASDETQIK